MIIRRRIPNLIVLTLMLVMLVAQTAGWPLVAVAQTSTLGVAPGTLSQTIRGGLFAAQDALGDKEVASANAMFADISDDIANFGGAIGDGPAADLADGVAGAGAALAAGDPVAFATARTAIWTSLLRGAYEQTIASVAVGRADEAFAWLLVREFRPTTRFAHPESNGTLAVRALARGETTPEAATEAIRADLLDTYQGKLATELEALRTAVTDGYPVLQTETAGLVAGYWRILESSYTMQAGPDANATATAILVELGVAVRAGDPARVDLALTAFADIERSFRAAPLSEVEQARRAGQLVRYLSLIPVEYGRGVKGGQVTLDIEIQEAQAFLDGAQAAFNDLYLTLKTQDATKTAEVDESLRWLQAQVGAAAERISVAEPGTIKDRANATIDTLEGMFPEAWTRAGGDADFDVIRSVLDQMEAAVAAGQPDLAESAHLEAYAIYEVGPEKQLLAFAPDLANRAEQLFWTGDGDTMGLATALQRGASVDELRTIRVELDKLLAEGQQRLGVGRPAKTVVIFNAATIVFREGLEGVLILASLVASMIGANRKFKRPLVIGAGLAFVATAILFWLAQTVLQSLSRYGEKLEAIVSLVAIGVLLLVMNWFFHKVYWTRWISKHHTRRRAVIGGAAGQALGLVVLGFTSVFREGAETVLFLQALVLDAGVLVVIEGTMIGLIGTAIVGALVLVLQTKLPHKKMLMVTGAMIAIVLVVMVGTTTHVLQVVGWLPITPVDGLILPYWTGVWFGLFPSWQGIVLQILALVFVVDSYYAAEYTQERRRLRAMPGLATSA